MMILAIILGVILLLAFYVISTRNSLVVLRNKVKDQFSQIDIQLKRRFDLIPNLVETVKGYAKHESETLENVIKARNTYLSAGTTDEKLEANNELTGALTKLFALSESYPELKANDNFKDLQTQLKECEEKIAYARQFYNDSVLSYNNAIELFPTNIVASLFKFTKEEFFQAKEEERENVKVEF